MYINYSVRLHPELREQLNKLAEIEERTPGDVMRRLLRAELARRGLLAANGHKATPVSMDGQGVGHAS